MNMITVLEIYLNSQAAEDTLTLLASGGIFLGLMVCLVQIA